MSETLPALLNARLNQIRSVLPRHITAERMARIALIEYKKTPELASCNIDSVMGAILQASQLGLELGSALGHAYLIPYKGKAQFQMGYKGMIDLARRSGQLLALDAEVVREKDEFSYEYGTNSHLTHKPLLHDDPGDPLCVYACARLRDGAYQFRVLSMPKVDEIRRQSKAGNSGPWKTHPEEMARKTAVRALFKYLPISIEMQRAIGYDEMADAGVDQGHDTFMEAEFDLKDTPQEAAAKKLKAKAGESPQGAGEQATPGHSDDPVPAQDDWDLVEDSNLIHQINGMELTAAQRKWFKDLTTNGTFRDLREFGRKHSK